MPRTRWSRASMSTSVSAARFGCGSLGLGSGLCRLCGCAAFGVRGFVVAARLGRLRLRLIGRGALRGLLRLLGLGLAVTSLAVTGLAVTGLAVTGLAVTGLGVSSLAVSSLAVTGLGGSSLAVTGLRLSSPAARTGSALLR